jgi:threonine synthase
MVYYSTRDRERLHPYSLKEAAFMGLAPDGGLFVPERIPAVDMAVVESKAAESYAEMACYLSGLFFGDDVPQADLRRMVFNAYNFDCPLVKVGEGKYTLELFHGPTFAFKDFGARFMGGMLGLLNQSAEDLVVLTATSGDTGSAVAAGFYNVPGIKVVVLYPNGKVSDLQESQMTTLGGNIRPVRVNGNFDDCQALVKQVFNDSSFRSHVNVTSANSINILRWIPQSFYYFYGWCQWKKATGEQLPTIVVPSGNYGNITAGMLAQAMGLPVKGFVAGSNANDVVPEYLQTGVYNPRESVRTIANAMDVGAPSNFERMMYLYGEDFDRLTGSLAGFSNTDAEIRDGIRDMYEKFGYVSDPHSAVGYNASKFYDIDGFWLSTAHHAKFREVIADTLGREFPIPEGLQVAMRKHKHFHPMDVSVAALEDYIVECVRE